MTWARAGLFADRASLALVSELLHPLRVTKDPVRRVATPGAYPSGNVDDIERAAPVVLLQTSEK